MGKKPKILLVYPVDFSQSNTKGISDKLSGQFGAFKQLGYITKKAFIRGTEGCVEHQYRDSYNTDVFTKSLSSQSLKFHAFFSALKREIRNVDIIYIRHLLHTPALYSFLKYAQAQEKMIIYEYPTYPYNLEWQKWWQKPLLKLDQYYFKKSEKLKDLVIHYGGYKGEVESVKISNGINTAHAPISRRSEHSDTFNLVAVGRWEYWHGLDRVLHGMAHSPREINLKVIGEGPSLESYKKLTKSLDLERHVSFYPPTYGDELRGLMKSADLGISTLGLHRKNVKEDSSLKSRTYCTMGLPFLHAALDLDFPSDLAFTFSAESDDSVVNLDSLINEYHTRLESTPDALNGDNIQQYAVEHLSWQSRIQMIHDKIVF